jgi:hypothetical protein
MRGYIGTFFGCEQCGRHFEEMAAQSLDQVKTTEDAVIWLWSKHNQVNSRLAGTHTNYHTHTHTHRPTHAHTHKISKT